MKPDTHIYRLIAVAKPKVISGLITVIVTLQNAQGKEKQEKIVFDDMKSAQAFYLEKQRGRIDD